ncbi:MAG: sensor histidine kinase [Candidatus Latescibacterota bacterium]
MDHERDLPDISDITRIESAVAAGDITAVLAVFEQQNRKLHETEERFKLALENASIAMYSQDGSLRYTWGYSSIPKLSAEAFLGHTDREIFLSDEADRMTAVKHKVMQTGEPESVEFEVTVPDGKKWLDVTIAPLHDDEGQVIGITGVARDITERKRSEEALRLTQASIDVAAEMIAWFTPDGRVRYANDATSRTLGYSRDELLNMNALDFTPGFTWEQYAEHWKEVRERKSFNLEVTHRRKDGSEYPAEVTVNHVVYGGQEYIFAYGRDITERKRTEIELRKYREHLEELVRERTSELEKTNNELRLYRGHLEELVRERTKDMETFDYSVSHNLRAPLRSLDGFSQILLEDYAGKLGKEGEEYLHRIRDSAQFMGELIEDLLALSKITRADIHRTDVDLSALVNGIMEQRRKENPEREVEMIIQEGVFVNGDFRLLHSAMEHLLENAWKFTSQTQNAWIEFGSKLKDGKTIYYVRDNGVGFNMQYYDKLFLPFHRLNADQQFPGTGIGLSIVKRIIDRHGGEIWAESEPGEGATFYFTLG